MKPQLLQVDLGNSNLYGNDTLMDDPTALFDDTSAFMGVIYESQGKAELDTILDIKPVLHSISN